MKLLAPAKVNLYLRIKEKRPDGYHNIETLFERVNLFDRVILKKKKRGISVFCDDRSVPTGRLGLCYRAAAVLKEKFNVTGGVKIRIQKRIPVAAGLGGGSSDAASILLGLNKLWDLGLEKSKLIRLGSPLGADIPFFLSEKSFAIGGKRGDKVWGLNFKKRFWHVIATPGFKLSAKEIYDTFDRATKTQNFLLHQSFEGQAKLKTQNSMTKLIKSLKKGDTYKIAAAVRNDLEKAVFKKRPRISSLKDSLIKAGCRVSLVSGSGPSIFGLFKTRKEAVAARRNLIESFPAESKEWRIFVVATY